MGGDINCTIGKIWYIWHTHPQAAEGLTVGGIHRSGIIHMLTLAGGYQVG